MSHLKACPSPRLDPGMFPAIAGSSRRQIQPDLAVSNLMLFNEGANDLADAKHPLPIFGFEKLRFELMREIVLKV